MLPPMPQMMLSPRKGDFEESKKLLVNLSFGDTTAEPRKAGEYLLSSRQNHSSINQLLKGIARRTTRNGETGRFASVKNALQNI